MVAEAIKRLTIMKGVAGLACKDIEKSGKPLVASSHVIEFFKMQQEKFDHVIALLEASNKAMAKATEQGEIEWCDKCGGGDKNCPYEHIKLNIAVEGGEDAKGTEYGMLDLHLPEG